MKKNILFVFIAVLCFVFLNESSFSADSSASLKPLLVDIEGWDAEEAEGTSVNMGAITLTTMMRSYSKDEAELDVSVIIGSNAMIQGQGMIPTIETDSGKVSNTEIDGFSVIQSYDKDDNSGSIIISLAKNDKAGAMLIAGFEGMNPEQALELAKKYDWEKLKVEAEKILK